MIAILLTDLQDSTDPEPALVAEVSDAGAQFVAALLRRAIEREFNDTLPGPIVADVMRVVTGLEREL